LRDGDSDLLEVWKLMRVLILRFTAGEVLFADVLLLPNGMSKVGVSNVDGLVPFYSLDFFFVVREG
jgi:hypothetical protein